jgi:uncharacterized membrane protein YeaQ/YmgE (transglycosylase-associated protein family)
MGPLSWIVFGALAGWLASIVTGSKDQRGCIGNIVLGIVGAFVGGVLMKFLTGEEFSFGFSLSSFVVAIIGALIVLSLVGAAKRKGGG